MKNRSSVTAPPDVPADDLPERLLTIPQLETAHPALRNRMRGFLVRADSGQPQYAGLRQAIFRLGRSVYIDEPAFLGWVKTHRAAAPAAPRNPHGRAGKGRAE